MLMMFTLSFQWPFSAQRMTENEAPNICSSWTGSVSSVSYGKKKPVKVCSHRCTEDQTQSALTKTSQLQRQAIQTTQQCLQLWLYPLSYTGQQEHNTSQYIYIALGANKSGTVEAVLSCVRPCCLVQPDSDKGRESEKENKRETFLREIECTRCIMPVEQNS